LKRTIVSLLALSMLLFVSCAKAPGPDAPPAPHPNQISAFDGWAYDALNDAQAAINQAKTEVASYPQYKTELNEAIAAYNAAQTAYKAYHNMSAGAPTEAQLRDTITKLAAQVAAIMKAFGGKP
jgi:hypothetical protein